MPLFSERSGLTKGRQAIQLGSMDSRLRIALYNLLYERFTGTWDVRDYGRSGLQAARAVWRDLWYLPLDTFPEYQFTFCNILKAHVREGPWNEVYDLVEFVLTATPLPLSEEELNLILEREMSGYRVRNALVVPISDATELSAIDEALAIPEPFAGARHHITDALEKLSLKPVPDLRNAITEAISAVESAARVVTGEEKATLADGLKALEKQKEIHPALKQAWLKLYGYTSDEQGLRHAMTDVPDIDFATAKYMVVSCSAFVNLLSQLKRSE